MRADGLVVGPEPSKLMARVQIPVGALSHLVGAVHAAFATVISRLG